MQKINSNCSYRKDHKIKVMKSLDEINEIKADHINYLYYDKEKESTVLIMDDEDIYLIACSTKRVLERLCIKYGSTLKGRLEFFINALGMHKKIPLLISERYEIILFPLYGFRNKESMWIAYHQIRKVRNEENLTTLICFMNDATLRVRMNYRGITSQMRRCKTMIKLLENL